MPRKGSQVRVLSVLQKQHSAVAQLVRALKNRNRLLVLTPTDITIFNFTFRIARSDARIHPVSVFSLISVYIFFWHKPFFSFAMVALTEGSAVIKWSSPAKNGLNVTSDTSTFLNSALFDFFRILLTNLITGCIMVNDSSRKIFRKVSFNNCWKT